MLGAQSALGAGHGCLNSTLPVGQKRRIWSPQTDRLHLPCRILPARKGAQSPGLVSLLFHLQICGSQHFKAGLVAAIYFGFTCDQHLVVARHPACKFHVSEVGVVRSRRHHINTPALGALLKHPHFAPGIERLNGKCQGSSLGVDGGGCSPHHAIGAAGQQWALGVMPGIDHMHAGFARLASAQTYRKPGDGLRRIDGLITGRKRFGTPARSSHANGGFAVGRGVSIGQFKLVHRRQFLQCPRRR